jgi:hypothetical protein
VDGYEPDDTPAEAHAVTHALDHWHSICPSGDVDYARFVAHQGSYYHVSVSSLPGDVEIRLQLYAPDGTTEMARREGRSGMVLQWYCTSYGYYFVKVSAVDPLAGAPGLTYGQRIQLFAQDTPTLPPPTPAPARYVPLCLDRRSLDDLPPAATAVPWSTPTATHSPEPTATPSATPTETEEPSIAVVSGRVVLGEPGGPGLEGVSVGVWIPVPRFTLVTDENGVYRSREMELHRETIVLVPSKAGYDFQPEYAGFLHPGYPGRHVYGQEFVAVPVTPTATAPTPTPEPAPANRRAAHPLFEPRSRASWIGHLR